MYQFEKYCVYKKCLPSAFCTNFCVLIFWNACFCSLIAFWPVRDFRPEFRPVSNLEAICFFFGLSARLFLLLPSFCLAESSRLKR